MHLNPSKKHTRGRGLPFWKKMPTIQADEKFSDKQSPRGHAAECKLAQNKRRLPWQKRKEQTSSPWMEECSCFELMDGADDSESDIFTRDSYSEFLMSKDVSSLPKMLMDLPLSTGIYTARRSQEAPFHRRSLEPFSILA